MLGFESSNIVSKTKTIGRRMFLISSIKAIILLGIFGRLASLQINNSSKYRSLADKNRFREKKIPALRGTIKDYFGNELASNEKIYQLHTVSENIPNINTLFFKLKKIINISDKRITLLKKQINKKKSWDTTIISDNLTWSEFSRINLFLHELQGAEPVVSVARAYKDSSSAHAIGYVSEISTRDIKTKKYLKDLDIKGISIGKTGLEASLDEQMLGSPGYLRYEVNAYGKKIKQVATSKGLEGTNFRTTLDQQIQNFAQEAMDGVSGAACVMDIYNGDIVSMVSSPKFNPNSFVHGVREDEWKGLLNNRDKPMLNKAISGLYPPGSTIKTLTALSALENDVISHKQLINCKGFIDLHGQRYNCWKKKGHGVIGMRTAIKKSCDVYFYEVARRLGIDSLAKTAKEFGLGKKILEGYNEEKVGVVPGTKWKLKKLGKNWYLGETLHSGIGQGYFLTTPLQLCLMTAQIANGGYKIKPKIIINENKNASTFENIFSFTNSPTENINKDNISNLKPLFRNQENINFVKEAMFGATNEAGGTSYTSRHIDKKFMFAGKTGSSQIKRFTEEQRKAEVKQKDITYLERDHAWFVAFAPVHNPKYAISVLVEHGGSGSSAAAPIAKKIIKKVLERDQSRTDYLNLKKTNI